MSTIYVIGSLRNPRITEVGNALRAAGYDTFEDWHAGGKEADDEWQRYEKERGRGYKEALAGYHARSVFQQDLFHLNRCHGAVLTLPAGKSGHLEFGYIVGQGKPGFVLTDVSEPERYDVMVQFATTICHGMAELILTLGKYSWPPVVRIPLIHAFDAQWLAGVLEGEGTFVCDLTSGKYTRPRIALQMTDGDIVKRAAKLLGSPTWGPYSKKAPRKDVWACAVTGAKAAEWMRILRPYLGTRRTAKINEILSQWTPRPYYERKTRRVGTVEEQILEYRRAPWNADI